MDRTLCLEMCWIYRGLITYSGMKKRIELRPSVVYLHLGTVNKHI